MSRKSVDVTEYELSVLQVLWSRRTATIREITLAVYGEISTTAYATVQKLLERLEKKDCVTRDRSAFAHVFSASIEREEMIELELESLAQRLCGGSLTPLLLQLVEASGLSPRDRRALRKLIEDAAAGGSESGATGRFAGASPGG